MISVIIATNESERPLLPTLAALVPGAMAGIVSEVIVADAGSHDGTAAVADVAGCRFVVMPGPARREAFGSRRVGARAVAPVPAAGQRAGRDLGRGNEPLRARRRAAVRGRARGSIPARTGKRRKRAPL